MDEAKDMKPVSRSVMSTLGPAISVLGLALHSGACGVTEDPIGSRAVVETFAFSSSDTTVEGKIFLPASYETNKHLPAIYLIDFTEQHFRLATDEFERVIEGIEGIQGFEALVVSLDGIPDIDAEPLSYEEHYRIFRDLASHVDGRYTSNTSRTFIGKGSEGGLVLLSLFAEHPDSSLFDNFIVTDPSGLYGSAVIDMIESGDVRAGSRSKKLHFSFSSSNDYDMCAAIISSIREADYPWLEFESVEYLDSDYESTYPVSFAAGLEYVFSE